MPHVVLARKYRPRSFEEMVGQAHVVQALGNALESGRLHHAYLFTGTRGIGKTTVSRILAKSLNCIGPDGTGGITSRPCGRCQACVEIDADRFVDYIELDAASNRGIEEARDLIERAAYKPAIGRFKVFMIDEAHQLTKDAFSALLKTLEEPPEYLTFVLATTDPQRMLPTVLSRCLQFNLRPMAPETVREHLRTVLAAEAVQADEGALRLLARAARGSMRDALSLTDQAIAFGSGRVAEDQVRAMLGAVDQDHAATLVRALAQRDGPALLATVERLREHGLSAAGTLEELARLLQRMAVAQSVPGALDEADPDDALAIELAAVLPADETQLVYSIALHGRAELGLVSDEYAALTMVLLRLFAFPPAGAPAAVAAAPRSAPLQVTPRAARAVAQPRTPAPPTAGPPATPKAGSAVPAQPARPTALPEAVVRRVVAQAPEPPPWLDVPPEEDERPPPGAEEPASGRFASAARDSPPPADDAEPGTPAVSAGQPLTRTPLGDRWAALLRPLLASGAVFALVRELACQAQPLAAEPIESGGTRWRLNVGRDTLRAAGLREKLEAALAAALGEPFALELVAGPVADSIALRDAEDRANALREADALIRNDPAVRELMAQFRSARIVPGSIRPMAPDTRDSKDSRA